MADHTTPPANSLQTEATMMNLEALIAEREVITIDPLPIPQEEMLARYEQLYTGAVSDVLREHCLMDQALPAHLIPLRPERTVAGVAFTVKSAPSTRVSGELTFRTTMLDQIEPGAFIVWDTTGDTDSTAWGGVMTATMAGKGVKAAAIDGGLRDTAQVLQKDFPVFYRHRSPNGSLGRCMISHYQVPIRLGTTWIRPGDIVLGDLDGVIVVPRRLAMAVLERAEHVLGNEREIFKWVAEGESMEEITRRGGYF